MAVARAVVARVVVTAVAEAGEAHTEAPKGVAPQAAVVME